MCRCRSPIECGSVALSGTARHNLLLAIKEALHNVIRHASATEVELQMTQSGDYLDILIADNGCGFDWNAIQRGNGLGNLHKRMQDLGGQCQVESQLGRGTRVRLLIPLPGQLGGQPDPVETHEITQ